MCGAPPSQTLEVSATLRSWYGALNYVSTRLPHCTQVWRATTQFGCGVGLCSNGRVVVCQYKPPGNMWSQSAFEANVLPPKA